MQDYRLSTDETRNLNQAMEIKMQEFDKVISQEPTGSAVRT